MIIKIVPAHFPWNNLHLVEGKITFILSVVYDDIKLDESSFPCGVFLKISCVWGHLRTEGEYRKRKMRIFENNFLIDSKENTRRMFHSLWRSPNFFLLVLKIGKRKIWFSPFIRWWVWVGLWVTAFLPSFLTKENDG